MWFICAMMTFFAWGVADLYYKKGNNEKDKYSHLKTGLIVGIVMGMHATLYLFFTDTNINLFDILKYLPVSLCYILSMVIGYKGLKYIELSVSSPIQNSSGIITSVLLCIIFKVFPSYLEIIGLLIMLIGVLLLSFFEYKKDKQNKHDLIKGITITSILFPIIYAIIDGLGTFLDAVYLDQLSLISESTALVAYEYTFLIYAVIIYAYLKIKKEKIVFCKEKNKVFAAFFETLGQFTYVFAVSSHAIITVPVIACYSALSVLLSRIFLKEKVPTAQYIAISIIFIGIIILAFVETII